MIKNHTKIEEIYLHLSVKQKKGIEELLKCSYFNQSKHLLLLHQFLSLQIMPQKEYDKEECYRLVFGKDCTYNYGQLRVYLTRLYQFIIQFLIIDDLDNQKWPELHIYQYFEKNQLKKNMKSHISRVEETTYQDLDEYFKYQNDMLLIKLKYHLEYETEMERKVESYKNLFNLKREKNAYEIMKTACLQLNLGSVVRLENDYNWPTEESISDIINNRSQFQEYVNWYVSLYLILKNSDEKEFDYLKRIVLAQTNSKLADLESIANFLINFCIKKINSGGNEYLRHMFEIYQSQIHHYQVAGDLMSEQYRNIVFCALQLKELEWAENFIENYYTKLPYHDHENSYNFNLARLYFEKQNYAEALKQLLKVKFTDSYYALNARILIIRCHFMLAEEEQMLYNLNSLYIYIKRNKSFTKERAENHLNFLKFTKKVYHLRFKTTQKKINALRKQILATNMIQKQWLLSMLE